MMSNDETTLTSVEIPDGWDMVVAIDPVEEAKLTGMDRNIVSGKYLGADEKIKLGSSFGQSGQDKSYYHLPIIVNDTAELPLKVNILYSDVNLDRDAGNKFAEYVLGGKIKDPFIFMGSDEESYRELNIRLFGEKKYEGEMAKTNIYKERLNDIPLMSSTENTINIAQMVKPFSQTLLKLTSQGRNIVKYTGGSTNARDGIYYQASAIKYEGDLSSLKAVPVGMKGGVPVFRTMEKKRYELEEIIPDDNKDKKGIAFGIIGHVKFKDADAKRLTGTPLGIYGDSYVYQEEDENGTKTGRKVDPTIPRKLCAFRTSCLYDTGGCFAFKGE